MARNVWDIPINEDTSREDLERCILSAAHTSDSNVTRAAADARAELARREREEWATRFDAQESARVKAQQFQAGQMAEQLKVAQEQSKAARRAAWAAWASALVAVGLLVLTAIQIFWGSK